MIRISIALVACSIGVACSSRSARTGQPVVEVLPRFVVELPVGFRSVAWSPDGRLVALREPHALQIRDGATGALRAVLNQSVDSVRWTADGSAVVVLGYRGRITRIELATGVASTLPALQDRARSDFGCAEVNADGTRIAIGGQISTAVWHVATGKRIATLVGHDYGVRDGDAFAADGKTFWSAREDGSLDAFDLTGGARTGTTRYADASAPFHDTEAGAVAAQAGVLAVGTAGGTIRIAGGAASTAIEDDAVQSLAAAPGWWIAATPHRVAVWDGHGAPRQLVLDGDEGDPEGLQIGGTRVAVRSYHYLHVFDVATGKSVRRLPAGGLAPDGATALVMPETGDPALVEVDTGVAIATLSRAPEPQDEEAPVRFALAIDGDSIALDPHAAMTPDGARRAEVIEDDYNKGDLDSIRVSDAGSGKVAQVIDGEFAAVGWAGNGVLAVVEESGRVRLLRLRDGAAFEVVIGTGADPGVLLVAGDGRFDGDERLLARVTERAGGALTSPIRVLADDAEAVARLRHRASTANS